MFFQVKKGTPVPASAPVEKPPEKFEEKLKQEMPSDSKQYELTAVVCYINEPSPSDRKNIVALIKVPDSCLSNATKSDKEDKWYLFNDFSICVVPAKEAVWFSLDWKVPCVLYYSSTEVTTSKTEVVGALTKVKKMQKNMSRSLNPALVEFSKNAIKNRTSYLK